MTFPLSPRGAKTQKGGADFPAALSGEGLIESYALPFVHYLTIPKYTTQADPLIFTMPLPVGMCQRLWIEFPKGCQGLAGVQVWRREQQIFPLPEGDWFSSDMLSASFAFTHSVHNEPYEVRLYGYNNDDTYSHTIWFAFEMTGKPKDLPPQLAGLLEYLKNGS